MASRILPRFSGPARMLARRTLPTAPASRNFQSSSRRLETVTATPIQVKKPVGAFRGGLFGFFLGSSLAGFAVYYYILDEYKVSNELLTEDIYAAVQRIHTFVTGLEERVEKVEKKK
ncbi:MAG: hypothetical protein M1824_002860 [Vezdaea acicularis]|nr:MAG: hypothetical protein M1824_002860 [Vezdaea acicularis]